MQIELTRNDYLYYAYTRLLKVYFLIIGILTSFRVGFVAYYTDKEIYTDYISDLIYAFFMGWRYDTIVASYLLIIPFLLFWLTSLLKSRKIFNFTSWFIGVYFYLATVIVLFISISDVGFYSFYQDHLNILFFGLLEDDTEAVMKSIWKNYPLEFAIVGFVVFLICIYFYFKRAFHFMVYEQRSVFNSGFFKYIFLSFIGITLLLGGARGGYGMMVLSPKYADFSKSLFVNQVALNGIITFEKAIKLRQQRTSLEFNMAKALGYGDNIYQAYSDYLGLDVSPTSKEFLVNLLERKTPVNEKVEVTKPHVIIFVMESFGGHWSQYNSEKFNFLGPLKKHFEEDIYFENFLSSGNGTIGSLMVIGTNIPYRNGARFISESRYMQLPLQCASHIPYKEAGYETSFVYGGKLGWRDIGKYFSYQKYHHVEGESHIIESLNLTGTQGTEWGLYDEHFFNHIFQKLEKSKRAQFVLSLSTSNHPPFEVPSDFQAPALEIPDELKNRIAREQDLFLLRFKAFQYANYKLAEFIQKIKDSDLANNTIIAVTGDHNFWGFMNYSKEETFSKYTVPFYLYIPKQLRPKNVNLKRFGSHEDIMPTLYNISLSQKPYVAFGEDLFGLSKSIAMNSDVVAGDEGIMWKGKFYKWSKQPLIDPVAIKEELSQINRQFRSTTTISDHYLRESYKNYSKE